MKLAFELEIPDGAVNEDMQFELMRSVKQEAVLKLYAGQRLTPGEAAEALGLTRIQFLNLLQVSGVGFLVDLDEEDFRMLRQWRNEHVPIDAR